MDGLGGLGYQSRCRRAVLYIVSEVAAQTGIEKPEVVVPVQEMDRNARICVVAGLWQGRMPVLAAYRMVGPPRIVSGVGSRTGSPSGRLASLPGERADVHGIRIATRPIRRRVPAFAVCLGQQGPPRCPRTRVRGSGARGGPCHHLGRPWPAGEPRQPARGANHHGRPRPTRQCPNDGGGHRRSLRISGLGSWASCISNFGPPFIYVFHFSKDLETPSNWGKGSRIV